MARPRTPTEVLELRGSFDKHPERRKERAGEPMVSAPLGPPPAHLRPSQRAAWLELERIAWWLTEADRPIVELTAILLGGLRDLGPSLPDAKIRRLESCLSSLGLTPVARSKVSVPGQQQRRNKFANNGTKAGGNQG